MKLHPQVVGEMRVLARCEDREISNGRHVEQWLCRCKCGALQKRTKSNIVQAITCHQNMACYVCNAEYRRGLRHEIRGSRKEWLKELWLLCGSLYPGSDWMSEVPPQQLDTVPREASPMGEDKSDHPASSQQRMAYMFPINLPPDRILKCCHCRRLVRDCFGCVICDEAVCIDCARAERHEHPDPAEGMTLVGTAYDFEVSQERIRQIEAKGLRKIRSRIFLDRSAIEQLGKADRIMRFFSSPYARSSRKTSMSCDWWFAELVGR